MKRKETATPSADKRAKKTERDVNKKGRDEEKAGGAFCIDWRDIEEAQNLKKEKAENETKKEKNVCEENKGEENNMEKDVGNEENYDEKSGKLNAIADESLTEQNTTGDDPSVVEKGQASLSTSEIISTPSKMNETMNSTRQKEEGTKTERKKVVTFASENLVTKEDATITDQETSGGTSKKGKRKISSLSDVELKKKIRIKEKKKKRRRASKCYFDKTNDVHVWCKLQSLGRFK